MRAFSIASVAAIMLLSAQPAAAAEAPRRPKKIFAHYMGCYPVAAAATAHHRANDAHKVRHDGGGKFDSFGDRWRNWALVPDGMNVDLEASAELELRRAMRAGIDGFAVDAWAGGEGAKKVFAALLTVAREKDYPLEITICTDPSCLPGEGGKADAIAEAIKWVIETFADNPKLARRDGKPLIIGYQSIWPGIDRAVAEFRKKPEFKDDDQLWKNPKLRTSPEAWGCYIDAFKKIQEQVGTPIYQHFGMGAFFHPVYDAASDDMKVAAAAKLAEFFPAVGEFLGGGEVYDRMAAAVRAKGAEWCEPMFFQYENIGWGGNRISKGADILRDRWEAARRNKSTFIQFVTWNDYTENTCLAPAYETRYAIFDLNRHFIEWWKTGKAPGSDRDKVYLLYRKYPRGARIYPFKPKQPDAGGVLEVLTILPAAATVRMPGRDAEWLAPAGMSYKQLALTPGAVVAEVVRDGKVAVRLESPEPITDRPFREQNGMTAYSTEFQRQWKADFPESQPILRGEYADADGDGLPNWFEMYWFGKFLDYSTATAAKPEADPDGDGRTNLQEYLDQTDPTKADQPRQGG